MYLSVSTHIVLLAAQLALQEEEASKLPEVAPAVGRETVLPTTKPKVLINWTVEFPPNFFFSEETFIDIVLTNEDLPHWSQVVQNICIREYILQDMCAELREFVIKVCCCIL